MAFPEDNQNVAVQMKIDGVWTDVVRYDADTKILEDTKIVIERGQSGLQDKTPASTCRWTWHDPNGIFNNDNPRSPYFGLIPRNTAVRVYVPRATPSLYLIDAPAGYPNDVATGSDHSRAQTTDKAALDIVGDIEIRFDIEPRRFTRWAANTNRGMFLGSKFGASGQRSWYVRIGDSAASGSFSKLSFVWSTNGTNAISALCTAALPTTGRISVKVTMDIDNGAAAREVKFWTSTTGIDGTYTQLGTTVTGAVTSIFSSTANVELGTVTGGIYDGGFSSAFENFVGRIFAFRLYDGIGGTLVANADFSTQTVGATSFADGLGNTWTIEGDAEVTDADYQFHGEISSMRQIANKSNSGTGVDVQTIASCAGIIQRISGNETPLQSPIYMAFSTFSANGWWTGEAAVAADTNVVSSAITGVAPAVISDITFAGYDATIPGSAGVMVCGSTGPSFVGTCKVVASTGRCSFVGYFKFPTIPLSAQTIYTIYSDEGTVRRWTINVSATTYTVRGFNSANTEIVTKDSLHGVGTEPTEWIAFYLSITQSGANVTPIETEWFAIGTDTFFSQTVIGTTTYAGTTGIFNRVTVQGVADLADVRFCHPLTSTLTTFDFFDTALTFSKFSRAFAGEFAEGRFVRICTLIGVSPIVIGTKNPFDGELMGPQPIDTPINILYQIPAVDGGVLTEAIDQLALEYRTRKSIYNQYGLELTWAQLSTGIVADPDNTDIANDIILTRDNGGSARAVLEYGPLSTQAPPNGINRVPDGPFVNNYQDSRLPDLVGHQLLLRTWPTARYPELKIDLHRSPFTTDATLQLLATKTEIADIVTVTVLPNFMPPEPIPLLVKGSRVELQGRARSITWAMVPYGPYQSNEAATDSTDPYALRASHHTIAGVVQTQVNTSFNDSTTQISVNTLSGATVDPALIDMIIKIGGERMTVLEASEVGSVAVDIGQFEVTTANWTPGGGSLAQSTTQAHGGRNSALITVSGSPSQATLRIVNAARPVIVAGESYRLSYWIYSSIASSNVNCVINWQDSGGGAISSSGAPLSTIVADTWTKISFTATAPALSAQCTYGPTLAGSPPNGTLIHFDGIDIAQTTNVVGTPQTLTVARGLDGYSAAHTAGDYVYVVPTFKARL